MATTNKARAWVPATVTTLVTLLLLFAGGLLREVLEDQDVSALEDPDNALNVFVYSPMAPLGSPGIVGDAPFGDSITRLGGGLVPVVVLVFLFTWFAARAARAGSSFTVLLGAWLGTVLGTGVGALVSFQIFVEQSNFPDDFPGLQAQRAGSLDRGLYWGATAGLAIGLVALLIWLMVRPRGDQPAPEEAPDQGPPDVSSYPPPPQHAAPATGASEETVRAPDERQ
jgi:hypothetical protein